MAAYQAKSELGTYLFLLARLAVVSLVFGWLYFEYIGLVTTPVLALFSIGDELAKAVSGKPQLYYGVTIIDALKVFAFVLLWWRVVKVSVLLGSPFPFGIRMENGRENGGVSGRLVTMGHVGDMDVKKDGYKGRFWFGVVVRAHPSSDKIVRARLDLLIMVVLPLGWTLHVRESRLFFQKVDHEGRAKAFRLVRDGFNAKKENMPADAFRKEVVHALRPIRGFFERANFTQRIDGLNWQRFMDGDGVVTDDFGWEMSFESLGDESYKVGEITLESVEELRALAKERLHPVPSTASES